MRLKEIFPHLDINSQSGDLKIEGISDDSRFVKRGDIFFIRKRKNFDIFSVLEDIEFKAAAFAGSLDCKSKLKHLIKRKPVIFVKNIQEEFFRAVDIFYGFTRNDLKFIGITGTNGKTTTTFLIYHLLKAMGKKTALIGSIKYIIGSESRKADYTTPDFLALRKILKKIKDKGIHFVVMEVSSHGIIQERTRGIEFSRCVFTNLSRDHLDYHKTMANYFNAKKKLFLRNKKAVALINIDDIYGKKIFRGLNHRLSYGMGLSADFRADNVVLNKNGSQFNLFHLGKSYPVRTYLCGRYNILNILGAISVVSSMGFSLSRAVKFISSFGCVKGRLEQVRRDIFVDYAHTPDALKNVLLTFREIGYQKIICVVGCGGDRDSGKRRLMGRAAAAGADFTFITSDNPRSEDPLEICRQIEKGFNENNYSIVLNRKKAIEKAVRLLTKANSGFSRKGEFNRSCILVAGKGHEDYQIIGDKKVPFKDSGVIKACLSGDKNKSKSNVKKSVKRE